MLEVGGVGIGPHLSVLYIFASIDKVVHYYLPVQS